MTTNRRSAIHRCASAMQRSPMKSDWQIGPGNSIIPLVLGYGKCNFREEIQGIQRMRKQNSRNSKRIPKCFQDNKNKFTKSFNTSAPGQRAQSGEILEKRTFPCQTAGRVVCCSRISHEDAHGDSGGAARGTLSLRLVPRNDIGMDIDMSQRRKVSPIAESPFSDRYFMGRPPRRGRGAPENGALGLERL